MIIAAALGVVLGIGLARFFTAFALLPALSAAIPGALLAGLAIDHSVASALSATISFALAIQAGFFLSASYRVLRGSRASSGVSMEDPFHAAETALDKSLLPLAAKLEAMRDDVERTAERKADKGEAA
jgi:hypothetical protein